MDVRVREAGAGDVQAVRGLVGRLAASHIAADAKRYTALETAWGAYVRALEGGESGRSLLWLVAERDGGVIGYLMAERVEADDLAWSPEHVCVHDLMVDEAVRGAGAGRALMDRAAAWARGMGVRQMRLFTDARNQAAREAFARLGFRASMVEMTADL
jgi:GNAT superfamily N-acetyltransferase